METGVYMSGDSWIAEYGEPDSLKVRVIAAAGVPDGQVSVQIDGQAIGGGTLSPFNDGIPHGMAVVPLPLLEVGEHEIVLSYAGNERFAPSSYTDVMLVSKADPTLALTVSPDHAWPGRPVTLTATLGFPSGMAVPTGSITFRDQGTQLAVVPVGTDGAATLTTPDLPVGEHQLSAIYTSDARYGWASATIEYDVRRIGTITELSVTPASATYGDTVRIAAVVRADVTDLGAPTSGTVTFEIDGRDVEVPVTPVGDPSDGVSSAVLEKADLATGTHRIEASYSGSGAFAYSTSSDRVSLVVARRTTSLTAAPVFLGLSPWLLPKAVLRATLTGNGRAIAGYPVSFTTGKTVLCVATTDAQGVATCDANAQRLALTLNGGYVAGYAGDANNTASSARGNLIG